MKKRIDRIRRRASLHQMAIDVCSATWVSTGPRGPAVRSIDSQISGGKREATSQTRQILKDQGWRAFGSSNSFRDRDRLRWPDRTGDRGGCASWPSRAGSCGSDSCQTTFCGALPTSLVRAKTSTRDSMMTVTPSGSRRWKADARSPLLGSTILLA